MRLYAHIAVYVLILLVPSSGLLQAVVVPHEPTPEPTYRDLRDNYVRTWDIYNDSQLDGILNPGDTKVGQFMNWWSPVSSHSMATYGDHQNQGPGYDLTSAPMNWATYTLDPADPNRDNPDYNYWLTREQNTLRFYMTYSQFDNNDWAVTNYGDTQLTQDIVRQRNLERNGWALGWVVHDYQGYEGSSPQGQAGFVQMDIYVHRGALDTYIDGFGTSRSNPQVSMSDDVDYTVGLDTVGSDHRWHPAEFDDASKAYTWAINQRRLEANGFGSADLPTLVGSMELRETDPYNLALAPVSSRTPQDIRNNGPTDHNGNPYLYEDAFMNRSVFANASTDGGVIAGLGGWSLYDPEIDNWGDQQVIRIDISKDSLLEGNITEIIFFDFGLPNPGSPDGSQVNPTMLVFNADSSGNLYYDVPGGQRIYFPENRLYIAIIPEPASLVLLGIGVAGILARRRRST